MTIAVAHAFTSAKSQGADATIVSKNEWNAGHLITCATGVLIGRTTASAGSAEEITPTAADLTLSAGALALTQPEYLRVLDAGASGTDVNTAQPLFPSTGTFTAIASTSYLMEAFFHISRTAGTNSHTTSILFGGTATFTSVRYLADVANPTGAVLSAPSQIIGAAATAVVVTAANTSATENLYIKLNGILRVNGAGTIIPQFQFSAAPGGAPTINANSYFRLKKVGANTVTANGAWS